MCRPKGFLRRFGLKTVTVFARFGISRPKFPGVPPVRFYVVTHAGVLCDDTKKGFVEDYGIRGVARNFPEVRGSFPNHLYTKIR